MNENTSPARDRLFALIASIPGSGSAGWCSPVRALLDEIEAASAVRPPATDRTALREQIAEALGHLQGTVHHLPPATQQAVIDALVPVLPEPTDRAAVLREAEEALRAQAKHLTGEFNDSDILHEDGPAASVATWKHAADLLRRMAAEPAAAGPDQTRPSCPDPIECGHEAALGEAQAAIERVRALHRKASHGTTCVYCAHGQRLGYDTDWPCDTIRALDAVPAAVSGRTDDATEDDCCGAEPPVADGWVGDCWCTLPPGHDGEHRCQPCTERHGAPDWPAVPAVGGAQPKEADRIVAYRSALPGAWSIYCTRHTDELGDGVTPLTSDDLPDGGVCASCGADVLIPQQPKEA